MMIREAYLSDNGRFSPGRPWPAARPTADVAARDRVSVTGAFRLEGMTSLCC